MSLALYRKYRSQTFAELVGQEHVTEPLQQALRSGRVHHAYLFSGPRGCGKTSSARILARSLNCEQGPTPDPCGTCQNCLDILAGASFDVIELDAASHGGVDDARDLRERASWMPATSRFKVYIVDEAHMVTREGFNALLKLVEEPPEHVKFIFATTEPERVLATIRSRTHHYPFRLLPTVKLTDHLSSICEKEGVTIDPRALSLVVRAGAGSARDALSILDQLVAGAGPDGVTYDVARALLGVTDAALLDEMVDALSARDGAAVFGTIARVVEAGHDPRRFTTDLLDRVRDLLVIQRAPESVEAGLLDAPPELLPRLQAQAGQFGPAELSRAGDHLYAGLTEMRGTMSPRLVLELVCARILLPSATGDESGLLTRVDRLERRLDIAGSSDAPAARTDAPRAEPRRAEPRRAGPAAPAAPPDAQPEMTTPAAVAEIPAASAPAAPPQPAPGGPLDAAAVRREWEHILNATKKRSRTQHALLQSAQVTDLSGTELILCFTTSVLAGMWNNGANSVVLQEVLQEVLGVDWVVRATHRAPGGEPVLDEGARADDRIIETPENGEDSAMKLLSSGLGAKVIEE